MSKLLRYFSPGQIYFVTSVTHERAPILIENAQLFYASLEHVKRDVDFSLAAWALLPDHFHAILDPRECVLSSVVGRLKQSFAMRYLKRQRLRSGRVWQRRFWDHVIRDQRDMERHLNYIHFNAVKHRLTDAPINWPHSSFSAYVEQGHCSADWGQLDFEISESQFGE